jgi:predicted esterase
MVNETTRTEDKMYTKGYQQAKAEYGRAKCEVLYERFQEAHDMVKVSKGEMREWWQGYLEGIAALVRKHS